MLPSVLGNKAEPNGLSDATSKNTKTAVKVKSQGQMLFEIEPYKEAP